MTPSAASTTAIGAPRLHPIRDPKTVSLTQTVRRPAAPAGISEEGRPFLLISGAHPVPELPDIPHDDHAAWIEFLGGFLLVLGLFTRLAAFVVAGEMAVALNRRFRLIE